MINQLIKPIDNLAIGKIIEVDGTRIIAELDPLLLDLSRVFAGENYPIGQFGSIIKVHFGRKSIYGLVSRLRMKADYELENGIPIVSSDERIIEADLFGEGEWRIGADESPSLEFQRGVATYPLPQQTIYITQKSELKYIYGNTQGAIIHLGEHVGSGSPCYAELNELLGKHTAILGSTGSGKSGTVSAVLHSILERGNIAHYERWHPQIIILDPHNEYGKAFPNHQRLSTDEGSLKLPYWLLDLEETISLFIGKTEYAATSQSNIVKNALIAIREQAANKLLLDKSLLTVDSPIPYILGDPNGIDEFGKKNNELYTEGLIGEINKQRPTNTNKNQHEDYNKVIRKISSLLKDGRLKFMMKGWDGKADPLPSILSQFLTSETSIQIVDLSGIPNEIAGITSAAIARIIFQIKVWQSEEERQNSPVLLVCEEAHRYVPNKGEAQYEAAQSAIRRIAKEGRKYGVGLFLISQRPSEVEATVLSQCNSWIVLRITNDTDREHVKSILPDSMTGLTKMLSGLRRQEAIFLGEAATLPSRIMIKNLEKDQLPKSSDIDFDLGWQKAASNLKDMEKVINRWRYQQR
ncbi:DNA helicase [Ignatzschineria sp. F8392]|uniref:ATP-binding protein n=1 Tax=Ignatzschineria sp. F8392 TaxID=1980117 RepID=UPI000B97EE54|nr:ATP-binding protein [Ignatzschineria sp. F8392]OYQ78696.1 DNA helicase [Ignatzschineria sp. F8392]